MSDAHDERVVRTACPGHCIGFCGILAHVKNGRVIKLEPGDFPDSRFRRICLRGLSTIQQVYHPDRLRYPLKRVGERGEGNWQRISWDEALDIIARRFTEIAAKYGSRSVAFVLGGPGGGTTKFGAYTRLASLFQGTRVSTFGYGDAALPCASEAMFGAHRMPFGSFNRPKLNIVWGANPAEASPFSMRRLLDDKQKGAKLVVIDPVFTITASKADKYLGVRPGTDGALALGMMNVILKEGLQDEDFIRAHTVGPFLVRSDKGRFLREKDIMPDGANRYMVWDTRANKASPCDTPGASPALKGIYQVKGASCKPVFQLLIELIDQYPPEKTAEITDVPAEIIKKLAVVYATDKPANIYINMGGTRT